MKIEDLLGDRALTEVVTDVRHPFDPQSNGVAIEFDGKVTVFIFEDPSDGYRSCAAEALIAPFSIDCLGARRMWLSVPVTVSSRDTNSTDGIKIVDRRNGKTILEVGTDNTDDYYPYFICQWSPQNLADNQPSENPPNQP